MRSSATAPGRCWPRRCRPRSRPTSRRMPGRSTSAAGGWWPQRFPPAAADHDRGRGGAGAGAAGQRQADRGGHWGAQAVLLGDPAGLVTQVAAGGRGAAAAVPARPVQLGLRPGVGAVLGTGHGLSAATITRLTSQWQDDARAFADRSLAGTDYVYLWVDGIHLKVRLEQDKVCLLVMIGVRADGRKELVALADGFRESSESWADLLRDGKRRGMAAPVLAVGDGALGFWKAVRDVFPETREQRCWWHKIGNVLNALPKSAQPAAKRALAEIYNAEDKTHATTAARVFAAEFGVKWPKAAAKITDDLDVLLAFYNYPAEHWIHLRTTTNPLSVNRPLQRGLAVAA